MKNVIVALPADADIQKTIFDKLKNLSWLHDAHLHFVHVFKEEYYPYMVPSTVYPSRDQKPTIKSTIEEIFDKLSTNLDFAKTSSLCLFHTNPKKGMVEYLDESKANLVICFTPEKHGITGYFHSSFTEFLVKHSPCDVLVLR